MEASGKKFLLAEEKVRVKVGMQTLSARMTRANMHADQPRPPNARMLKGVAAGLCVGVCRGLTTPCLLMP